MDTKDTNAILNAEDEKAILAAMDFDNDDVDLDVLEQNLQAQLEEKLGDIEILKEDYEKIGNPDQLGETVINVVWEQFMNQIAVTAGEEFIEENRGLTLDLRKSAHIQTTENFEKGKIATHNTEIDYQERYEKWDANFQHDENGNRIVDTHYRGKNTAYKLNKDARADYDKGRPTGSNTANTNMDHTISAAEIIRDSEAGAHLSHEEKVSFANSEDNLNMMDSAANQSKGDMKMDEWLQRERNGEKPADRFNIDEDELREKDQKAREEYEKKKDEGKKQSIETGKQSRKQELFKIGGKALRTAFMSMLANLVKEIIGKLVKWLKSAEKSIKSLIEHIKAAILSFVSKLKQILLNAGDAVLTTIATSIIGPVVGVIKKTIALLRQGWDAIKKAVAFLRDPANKGKPLSYLLPQVGIIVVTALSGIGAIVLGEFIEKALMNIPFLATNIPIIGSPANIIGMLMGAIVCGIIGAIAINLINRYVAKKQKSDNIIEQIDTKNEILSISGQLTDIAIEKVVNVKEDVSQSITQRHNQANVILVDSLNTVFREDDNDDNEDAFSELDATLDKLLN